MLQESTHVPEIFITGWTFIVTIIIVILVGCVAFACIVVDIIETNAGRAGSLFQVQDHGGFGHEGAITCKTFDTLLAVNELVLLRMLGTTQSGFYIACSRQVHKE
jgi:hypothetical protein